MTDESDHMALLLKVLAEPVQRVQMAPRGLMFEEMWLKHDGYEDMIAEAWENSAHNAHDINGLWRRLHDMSRDMKSWSFETFGSVRAEIKKLRSKLDEARKAARLVGSSPEVLAFEQQLHAVLKGGNYVPSTIPSRAAKAGDQNTFFFKTELHTGRGKIWYVVLERLMVRYVKLMKACERWHWPSIMRCTLLRVRTIVTRF